MACMVWLNLTECQTHGIRVTAAFSLVCAFSFWRHCSAKSSVETLQCGAEGAGGTGDNEEAEMEGAGQLSCSWLGAHPLKCCTGVCGCELG